MKTYWMTGREDLAGLMLLAGGAFGRRWEVLLLYEGRIMYIALAPINYCKCIC